ncbi:MAG: NAD(P)H-binding protein [Solirubrobacteraceae bacterium]
MNNTSEHTTLILGGTGKTGRRIVERLHQRDVPVRVGSRSGEPPFDWEDRGTWAPALQGTSAAYVSFFPDVAVPGAPEAIAALADLAVAGGTRRLVLLSGRGEEEAQRAEQALQASGAEWTIVRCSWFMQNFSEGFLRDAVLAGEVALPVGETPEPFVDTDDIADVATVALTEPGHAGQVYELTGPRMLTFGEAVAEIAAALERPVAFTSVDVADYAQAMREQGLPEDVVALVSYLFAEVLDGRNAHLADGVQRALGRPPRDFAQFARTASTTGAWSRA